MNAKLKARLNDTHQFSEFTSFPFHTPHISHVPDICHTIHAIVWPGAKTTITHAAAMCNNAIIPLFHETHSDAFESLLQARRRVKMLVCFGMGEWDLTSGQLRWRRNKAP